MCGTSSLGVDAAEVRLRRVPERGTRPSAPIASWWKRIGETLVEREAVIMMRSFHVQWLRLRQGVSKFNGYGQQ